MAEEKSFTRIQKLNGASSKEEELEALHRMVEVAGTNTYLSSLFDESLIGHMEWVIKNDWSGNVWEEFQSSKTENGVLAEQVRTLNNTVAELQERLEASESLIRTIREAREAEQRKYQDLLNTYNDQCEATTGKMAELYHAEEREAALQDAIVHLKADLYDLVIRDK